MILSTYKDNPEQHIAGAVFLGHSDFAKLGKDADVLLGAIWIHLNLEIKWQPFKYVELGFKRMIVYCTR